MFTNLANAVTRKCPPMFQPILPTTNVTAKLHVDQQHLEDVNMKKFSSGKCSGIKRLFKLEEIWRIRTRLELESNLIQLALLNLAIDSELRASDLRKMHVYDVSSAGVIYERVQYIQQKTGTDVHYEITPRTQQSSSRVLVGEFTQHT